MNNDIFINMDLEKIIRQVLKEDENAQKCSANKATNDKLKEYKYYRLAKCSKRIFDDLNKNIRLITNLNFQTQPKFINNKNIILSGKYKGREKNTVLQELKNEYSKRLNETCGNVIFNSKDPKLNVLGGNPCEIPDLLNDYSKNQNSRIAFNKYMDYPENENVLNPTV